MIESSPQLSVIVPCFNEEENVEKCVTQLDETLRSANISHEILLVNDGSTDGTLGRARSLSKDNPWIRIVDLGDNFGKATALKEGVKRARGEILAFFDADLQYAPKDLVAMVARLDNGVDFVNGSRDYNGYGVSRTAFSRLYNRTLRSLFRIKLKDANCGIKILRKEAAKEGSIFDYGLPLIVPVMKINGLTSAEFPVTLHERRNGESKYFQEGQFLGGTRNIRDISYHSIMLIGLVAHASLQSVRQAIGKRASASS